VKTTLHDAVVVGAGPAGSILALLLARAGCDVVLIERASFPRAKACGDCLSAEATRLLRRLDLLPSVLALEPARLVGWRIYGPRRASFSAAFRELGDPDPDVHTALAVPRQTLDAALVAAAARAGAHVLMGWSVDEVMRDGAITGGVRGRDPTGSRVELAARLTVGADGLRSRIARQLGAIRRQPRVRKVSLTTHAARAGGGDWFGEMHVGDGVCAGLAPVGARGERWNVTVVVDAHRFGHQARRPRPLFKQVLRQLPALAATEIEPAEILASGPFDWPVRRITFPGAALVGDAAGYFDPFTGQGIFHALAGAELLAAVATPLLRDRGRTRVGMRDLLPYAHAHARLSRGPRRVQRIIDQVLARPALAELAIASLHRRPHLAAALLAVTGDLRPASSLLSPGLAVSLLLPPRWRRRADPGSRGLA